MEGGAGGRDHPASPLGLALQGPGMLGDSSEEAGGIHATLGNLLESPGGRGWSQPPA